MLRWTRALHRAARIDLSEVPAAVQPAFRLLKVGPRASAAEVKSRYHALARSHHPDVNAGDESKMQEVNRAYRTVLNHLIATSDAPPRPQPTKTAKVKEVSKEEKDLLGRLASWLRDGDPNEDPTAKYREFAAGARHPDEILGSDEDEMKWAQRWLELRDERLRIKNQWRRRHEQENPFDPERPSRVQQRLSTLDVTDPLYRKLPKVPPQPPRLLAGSRGKDPLLMRRVRQQRLADKYLGPDGGAQRAMEKEQRRERKRMRMLKREFRVWLHHPSCDPADMDEKQLLIRMHKMHKGSFDQLAPKTGPSDTFDNDLQIRAPKQVRFGKLVSFLTKDGAGESAKVLISHDAMRTAGASYLR